MLWVQKETCRDDILQLPAARLSTRGVIPQSGRATHCNYNLIRDTSPHTLQFASWYSVALHGLQLVATCTGPLRSDIPDEYEATGISIVAKLRKMKCAQKLLAEG
jgi:hypothetical protein